MTEIQESAALTNVSEVLLRQIHPTWRTVAGVIMKIAFIPSEKDDDLLSVRREEVGAEAAYSDWIAAGRESIGTYGVSVQDVHGVGLKALDDATESNPGHASVDFSPCESSGQKEKIGRKLRSAAAERGCLHDPERALD